MAKKVNNKLTLTAMKSVDKKFNTTKEIHVVTQVPNDKTGEMEDRTFDVKIDLFFRTTKIQSLLNDLVNFYNEGSNRLELLGLSTSYISLLIIKHFTDVEVPDDIDKAIIVLNYLIDLDVLNKILNELPDEEVVKIHQVLNSALRNMENNLDEADRQEEAWNDKLNNPQVKEMLNNGRLQ